MIHFFDEKTGMWCKEIEHNIDPIFEQWVKKFRKQLVFKVKNKILDYGGNRRNINLMKTFLGSETESSTFMKDRKHSSIGKLLFANGYYDFNTNTFTKGFNKNIVFFKCIRRNFPETRNEALIKTVHDLLFVNAFDVKGYKEAGEYLKKALCCSLYGNYRDKKFHMITGLSNCGKGVLITAMTECFEGYVDEFDANNFQHNDHFGGDNAKRNAWMKDLENVRIAFSSEIRKDPKKESKTTLDGNYIKLISSGGDGVKIRGNFENQYKIAVEAGLFMLANDIPPISPPDEALCDRLVYIRYMLRFVKSQADVKKTHDRVGDPDIKDKFTDDIEYKNALLHVFIDTYIDIKKNGITVPQCVLSEKSNWITDETTIFNEKFNEQYEVTNNPEDKVESGRIIEYLKFNGVTWSEKKITMELDGLVELDVKTGRTSKKRYRLGIKERLFEE
jgi:phage/plasmid-associated DNA primase